ncbi:MAG: hypothetical protein GXP28_05545 [Planctomycetes bacterium]|nr:hypothetical protein [Planctomycetota bacterium]
MSPLRACGPRDSPKKKKKTRPMPLTDQIAQLWTASTPPISLPTRKLPQLPEPLPCELDHHDPANWKYSPDRHGRAALNNQGVESPAKAAGDSGATPEANQERKRPKR